MKQLEGLNAGDIKGFVQENLDKSSVLLSDRSTSYTQFSKYVDSHITVKSSKVSTRKTLQWVHIAIANLKRTFSGVYHRINQEYLQLYLDEFCYKLNHRYFKDKLFDRLVIAVVRNYTNLVFKCRINKLSLSKVCKGEKSLHSLSYGIIF